MIASSSSLLHACNTVGYCCPVQAAVAKQLVMHIQQLLVHVITQVGWDRCWLMLQDAVATLPVNNAKAKWP